MKSSTNSIPLAKRHSQASSRAHATSNLPPQLTDSMQAITAHAALLPVEIYQLTGYRRPCMQLFVLHKRGFTRAYMGRKGVVLERPHFEAVCRGQAGQVKSKEANLNFFGGRQ